jgi:hypothetical protein
MDSNVRRASVLNVSSGSFSTEMAYPCHVCFSPDSDHSADIWGGPFRAISEVGPAYSIASAARTVPRVRLTPRGCLLTLYRQRSDSLFRASRPLLPGSNALLNIGRRSPRADIASAGWKCL